MRLAHLAYAFVPADLIALGLTVWGMLPAVVGLHLLRIGAIGGMTLAALMRASSGHAGRGLQAGPALTAAFVSLALAALARAAVPFEPGLRLTAALWACGFAIFLARMAPVLTSPNPARRGLNPRPR